MLSFLAAAALSGSLTFFPSNSIDTAAIVVQTSAGCPSTADTYYAIATGHGFGKDGQVVTAPTAAGMSRTEGFNVFFAQTMKDFAADNGTTLQGRYDVSVFCADSFTGTKFAEFTGQLTFSSPTKYKSSGRTTALSERPVPGGQDMDLPASGSPTPEQAPASEAPPATPVPVADVAAPIAAEKKSLPVGWIGGGVAAILLAFEIGRRIGRRSATTRP
ncbi:hypothetical protein BJ973_007389 [Actinoplanes tereljensis]|uniref:Uncharacterized protein n=1 Tax=Paractinoplanes tereljensis TaxID=571912 RepID=A0A919NU13_9ACTN|nr:hypothetical protein [Actinoplanes tereljensis]GIF25135.1 hypothetical protein Ate02nite_78650 [Actinoplanes tereljensis]